MDENRKKQVVCVLVHGTKWWPGAPIWIKEGSCFRDELSKMMPIASVRIFEWNGFLTQKARYSAGNRRLT